MVHLLTYRDIASFCTPSQQPASEVKRDLGLKTNLYGLHNSFSYGFANVKSNLEPCHPLEVSERNFAAHEEKMHLTKLRNTEGLHAPLKLAAELRATRSVGRLPFLESSQLSTATLLGSDDTIDFTDFLNLPEQDERFFVPHVVMEHKLGIL